MPTVLTTALQIIESGYVRSTGNDPGKLAVDGEMIAYLNREYLSLFAILATKSGDNTAAKQPIVWVAGTPPSIPNLPVDIIDVVRIETNAGGRTYLIPIADKDRTYHLAPAFYRVGNTLYSRGGVGDPNGGDTYTLFYKDSPAPLVLVSSTLDPRFPSRYENILVLRIAIYLAIKDQGRNPSEIAALNEELKMVLGAFGLLTAYSNTAKETPRPVQPAAGQAA